MIINELRAFPKVSSGRQKNRLAVFPASPLGRMLLLGILCVGLEAPLAACPDEAATMECVNQVIPPNAGSEYQQAGEASRVNGTGPRKYNKVQKVLLYDWAMNGNHAQGKAAIRRMMVRMANRFGFELEINDSTIYRINIDRLQGANVVIFTQGDADVLGNNATSASAIAMENYIYRQGGSLLMMHAASAFISCPGIGTGGGGQDIHAESCRFLARAAARQYYHSISQGTPMTVYADSTQLGQVPPHAALGAINNIGPEPPAATLPHGRVNPETKNMFDNSIPFNWKLPPNGPDDPRTFVWNNFADEWYNYASSPRIINATMVRNVSNFTPAERHIEGKVNILLSLDEMSLDIGDQKMGDHPVSWTRRMGKGLSAYSNIGHNNAPFLGRSGGGRRGVDTLAAKYTWNLIRYLSRDYEGCMDAAYADFNPHASVKTITGHEDTAVAAVAAALPPVVEPCVTLNPVSISVKPGQVASNGIEISANRVLVSVPKNGLYHITITDLRGRAFATRSVFGGMGVRFISPTLSTGQYIVRVRRPKSNGFEVIPVTL